MIVGAVLVLNKKNRAHKHHQAETIREEAVAGTPAIQESELHAREAEARAERARLQAERAEHEAASARQGVDVEQAALRGPDPYGGQGRPGRGPQRPRLHPGHHARRRGDPG